MNKAFIIIVSCFAIVITACSLPGNDPNSNTVERPEFNNPPGTYSEDIQIILSTETEGASIFYSTDGSDPDASSNEYVDPIDLSGNGTSLSIKAVALKEGMTDSEISSGTFSINYASPLIEVTSHTERTYTDDADVTLAGTASVNGDPEIALVEIKINDSPYESVTGTNSWFHSFTLSEGENTILLR